MEIDFPGFLNVQLHPSAHMPFVNYKGKKWFRLQVLEGILEGVAHLSVESESPLLFLRECLSFPWPC